PKIFDLNKLGPYADRIPNPPRPLVVNTGDVPHLLTAPWTARSRRTFARVVFGTLQGRLLRRRLVGNGPSLLGQMLLAAIESDIDVWTDCPVTEIVFEDG